RSSRQHGGVTVHVQALTQPGLTFVTAYDGQYFRPFVIDIDGNVLHRWDTRYGALFHGETETDLVSESRRYLQGAYLYADGSVLASFEYKGLAKLDRCSRPVWLLRRAVHHSL